MPTEIPTPDQMEAIRARLMKSNHMRRVFKKIEIQGHHLYFLHNDGRRVTREVKLCGDLVIFEYPLAANQTARISISKSAILP